MLYRYLFLCLLISSSFVVFAQCPAGQVEVSIQVTTDNWGYESYWQLLPSGNNCGNGAVFTGGNNAVGCNGGGNQSQTPGGYADNATIVEGPWCLTDGASYDIYSVDDFGDGGTGFLVTIAGFGVQQFTTTTTDETFTFAASAPPAVDGKMKTLHTPTYVELGDVPIGGVISNEGTNNITSFTISYSVNSGAEINYTQGGVNIPPFTDYTFNHNIPWQPSSTGLFSIMASISNVNGGGADENPNNDAITKNINVKEPIPNLVSSYLLAGNTFTSQMIVNSTNGLITPRDLDFHPNNELWIVNQETEAAGGSVVTVTNAGEANQTSISRKDGNAWHFMSLPSGIAFSTNGNFATSLSVFDANHTGGPNPFTGPSLWSSDPAIFAQPSGGNGSHLDMLHESPYSMGIAAEKDNVFWVFDANSNDVVRYDFAEDHGPGNDYHGDASVRRYPEINVDWINQGISSHLVLDKAKKWLYIVDGGGQRVLRLDITTGTPGGNPVFAQTEALAEYTNVTGTTWEVMVNTGLSQPSGIEIIDDRLIVSDHSNGDLIFFDISVSPAVEMGRVSTGSAGIQGIKIGPQGRLWYVNSMDNQVNKMEPDSIIPPPVNTGIGSSVDLASSITVFPNPVSRTLFIELLNIHVEYLKVYNTSGQEVFHSKEAVKSIDISSFASGTYFLHGVSNGVSWKKEFSVQR